MAVKIVTKKVAKVAKTQKQESPRPVIEEFRGKPQLNFEPDKDPNDGQFPFRIGLRKLTMIYDNWELVKAFVESDGESLGD